MCKAKRELRAASPGRPAEGETVRLGDWPGGEGQRCAHFPWWTLWLLWPLFWLLKGTFALAAPVASWLAQPLTTAVTPLPLLLIGAGVAALAIGALRRRDR